MSIEDIMFLLMRNEICCDYTSTEWKNELTTEKYRELFILSRKHDVSHIIASALSHADYLGDDDVSCAFQQGLMKAVYRDANREYAIHLTEDALEKAQIPHILLKGSVLRHLYPQTWMRSSCDIDVLIRKTDVERAEKVLCENGYDRLEDGSTYDLSFATPNRIHLELHHTLTQDDAPFSKADELLASVWDRYAILEDGTSHRYQLTPELFVIYHLAHMGRHLLHGGCGVRPFLDLWLMNKQSFADPVALKELMIEANLFELYQKATELSRVWLEGAAPTEKTKQLETFILSGGVYGSTENAVKVTAANGIGKTKTLLRWMFLSRDALQVLYPNLKKHPILYPFYQVKRWFRIFNKTKRAKVKRMTDARGAVTQDQIGSTAELLRHLGLDDQKK